MADTYVLCKGTTDEELNTSVQECLDAGYGLVGSASCAVTLDKNGDPSYVFAQAVRKKNA